MASSGNRIDLRCNVANLLADRMICNVSLGFLGSGRGDDSDGVQAPGIPRDAPGGSRDQGPPEGSARTTQGTTPRHKMPRPPADQFSSGTTEINSIKSCFWMSPLLLDAHVESSHEERKVPDRSTAPRVVSTSLPHSAMTLSRSISPANSYISAPLLWHSLCPGARHRDPGLLNSRSRLKFFDVTQAGGARHGRRSVVHRVSHQLLRTLGNCKHW